MRYVAFLRGINISGKNKIQMSQLKQQCRQYDLLNVRTYLNSGNIIFDSTLEKEQLASLIHKMIQEQFQLVIPVLIKTIDELKDIIQQAPQWWLTEDQNTYYNLIMIIPPKTYQDVYQTIGEPNQNYEQIKDNQDVIYWSFIKKDYSKTNYIKTASTSINDYVTIRTKNTIKKIIDKEKS